MKKEHFDIAKKLEKKKNHAVALMIFIEGAIRDFKASGDNKDALFCGVCNEFSECVTKLGVSIQNECEQAFSNL